MCTDILYIPSYNSLYIQLQYFRYLNNFAVIFLICLLTPNNPHCYMIMEYHVYMFCMNIDIIKIEKIKKEITKYSSIKI